MHSDQICTSGKDDQKIWLFTELVTCKFFDFKELLKRQFRKICVLAFRDNQKFIVNHHTINQEKLRDKKIIKTYK